MKLTAENVHAVMTDVLFKPEEMMHLKNGAAPDNAVLVEGIIQNFGFHSERLNNHKEDITSMLTELPDQFRSDVGGGWSFLAGCLDRDGNQWGEQRSVEALFCLGIAIGKAQWLLKADAHLLPGGVPYFVIN